MHDSRNFPECSDLRFFRTLLITYCTCLLTQHESSPPEMFLGKAFLKKYSTFTGEHPCQSVILIKLLCSFIEIAFWQTWVFSCRFAAYFQNTFFLRTSMESYFWYYLLHVFTNVSYVITDPFIITANTSVIRQKGESQNRCFKKISTPNFPINEHFLLPDTHTYVIRQKGESQNGCFLETLVLRFALLPYYGRITANSNHLWNSIPAHLKSRWR